MQNKRIALIVDQYGAFEVRVTEEGGWQNQIAWSPELGECLKQAAMRLGHPIVIPISGPDTSF